MLREYTTTLKPEIKDTTSQNPKSEFKAAVGLSRKWNAREAGREVAADTLQKLGKGIKPNFILLFSTIHYEKHGGFHEFLNGVWDVLPEGTPLIGGTVAGFINPQGCYTRGTTALAVNYPNMDVAIGIGKDTKKGPQQSAKQCANMITEKLKNSTYNNNFIFELISGTTIFFPYIGLIKIIKSRPIGELIIKVLPSLTFAFGGGLGKEEVILEHLVKNLPEYTLLGG